MGFSGQSKRLGKYWIGVAIAVTLSVTAGATYAVVSTTDRDFGTALDGCNSASCKVVEYQGEKFELTGEALAKFNNLHNSEIPYEAAQLQAPYVPTGRQFTLAIEGSNVEAQKLVERYNIEVHTSKINDAVDNAVIIGSMSNTDIKKFLAENSLKDLEGRNLIIAPVGGYTDDDGEKTGFNSFLDDDSEEKIAAILTNFENQKVGEIVSSGEGVKKVG